MDSTPTLDRAATIRASEAELRRWNSYVETLLRACRGSDDLPEKLQLKLEELRNKRDCVVTKVEALKRHKDSGWAGAQGALEAAARELRNSWRSVIGTLERESQFI